YTLPLHDALPISRGCQKWWRKVRMMEVGSEPVVNDEGTKKGEIQAPQLGVIAQAPKQDLGQGKMLVSGSSPLAIQQPTPIPQVAHGTTPQMPYWEPQPYPQRQAQKWGHIQVRYRGGGAGRSRGRGGVGRGKNQRDGPQRCWACGELGHIFRHCYKEQNVGEQGDYQTHMAVIGRAHVSH